MVGSVRMPISPEPPTWGRPLFLEVLLLPCCVCFTLSFIVGKCWRVWVRDINPYRLEEMFRRLGQALGIESHDPCLSCVSVYTVVHSTPSGPAQEGPVCTGVLEVPEGSVAS